MKIGISIGDPAGIGAEVIAKALLHYRRLGEPNNNRFHIFAHPQSFSRLSSFRFMKEFLDLEGKLWYFVEITENVPIPGFGELSANGGEIAYQAIRTAVNEALSGKIDAIVTAPINKKALWLAGHKYPGQTELLADLTNSKTPFMTFIVDNKFVGLLTTHLPLSKVPERITAEVIIEKALLMNNFLEKRVNIASPSIALLALNPHGGESGLFGSEEKKIFLPALEYLKQHKINIDGPYPADTFFAVHFNERDKRYNAVLSCYHDQALIPVKLLGFNRSVNLTLGLPFIRTSPDHGTAFNIAGKGEANPGGMIEAIRWAVKLSGKDKGQTEDGRR